MNNKLGARKLEFFKGNGKPFRSKKVSRNEVCKCGSGKKAKKCCGTVTSYFQRIEN